MQAQAAVITRASASSFDPCFPSEARAAVMLARVLLPFKHVKTQDVLPRDAEKLGNGKRAMRVTEGLESNISGKSLVTLPLGLSNVIG